MRSLLVAVFAFLPVLALGQSETNHRHIVSIGTDGLGWSGIGTKFDWDKDKGNGVKDAESSSGSLALNYNYVLPSRFMIGAEVFYESSMSETKYTSGEKEESESVSTTVAFSLGYNFNEDLLNSWWAKASLGAGVLNTETTDTTETPEKTETDIDVNFLTLEVGKRISLNSWGLGNFSYSPSVALTSASYGEDAKDAGLENSASFTLNILKFDIVF